MTRYLIVAGASEHEVQPAHVIPWLLGYLARLGEEAETTQLVEQIVPQITALPEETITQTCYRTLKICHDQRIIVYRGIRRE